MQQTADQVSLIVAAAKGQFEHECDRLTHLFSFVPDDKLTWAPVTHRSLRLTPRCP